MKPGFISKRCVDKKLILERKMLGTHQILTLASDFCNGCGICTVTCPEEAPKLTSATINDGRLIHMPKVDFDSDKCTFCGVCVALCPMNALQIEVNGKPIIRVVEAKAFPTLLREIDINVKKCNITCNLVCQNDCPTKAIKVTLKRTENGQTHGIEDVAVDRQTCIFCKKCESVCPQNAIRVVKPFYGVLELNTNLCPKGCQVCADACPSKTISLREDGKPQVEQEFCIYCGACKEACPANAISLARTQILHTDTSSGAWITVFEKLTSRPHLIKELTSRTHRKLRQATQNIGRF